MQFGKTTLPPAERGRRSARDESAVFRALRPPRPSRASPPYEVPP